MSCHGARRPRDFDRIWLPSCGQNSRARWRVRGHQVTPCRMPNQPDRSLCTATRLSWCARSPAFNARVHGTGQAAGSSRERAEGHLRVRDRPHLLMLMAEHSLPGQPAPIVKVALGQRADEGTFATINVTDDGHAQVHYRCAWPVLHLASLCVVRLGAGFQSTALLVGKRRSCQVYFLFDTSVEYNYRPQRPPK